MKHVFISRVCVLVYYANESAEYDQAFCLLIFLVTPVDSWISLVDHKISILLMPPSHLPTPQSTL